VPEIAISPLPEAVRRIAGKTPVAARLSSAEWSRVPLALRERAQFSARVESLRVLGTIQERLEKRIGMVQEQVARGEAWVGREDFIADVRAAAIAEGVQTVGETGAGTVRDIRSNRRLGLIYDFQTRQAAEFARWKVGEDPDVLDAFPAQELIREEDRVVPRDWRARWAGKGGRFFGGRMIALKSDPVWTAISAFGTPFPPFDFGSGMGIEDVSREEAEALGLMRAAQGVQPQVEAQFNDRLDASAEQFPEQARQEFKRVFGDRVSVAGDSVAWVGEKGGAVGDLWDRTRQQPDLDAVVALGAPRPQVLAQVQALLGKGRDWDGIVETVASKDFNHVRNTHPDVTREDALRIPLVLDSPDEVSRGDQPWTVKLRRRFRDGTVYYVEAYVQPKTDWPEGKRTAPPELRTKTMWKGGVATGMPLAGPTGDVRDARQSKDTPRGKGSQA
jgi:hypothetical protein